MVADQTPHDDVMILEVTDQLRGDALLRLKEDLTRRMEHGHVHVVVDMARFEHADSAGLGYLVQLQKELRGRSGRCAIARPNADFKRLIDITGLDMILPVFDSIDEARASFA